MFREWLFSAGIGGEGGIRTHGTLARTAVFKTAALNHSATSPAGLIRYGPSIVSANGYHISAFSGQPPCRVSRPDDALMPD